MTCAKENSTFRGYPADFWLANLMELCERAAYYGFFIVLTLYLTDVIGFTDKETGFVAGIFFAGLYFLPPFVGAISDKIGFKNGLILAFALLGLGYCLLGICGALHDRAAAEALASTVGAVVPLPIVKGSLVGKVAAILFLLIAMVGGSFIKPLITGTVAKTTSEQNRARGFALFYWVVNIGAFSGKTLVPFIRQGLGIAYVSFFSALMAVAALLVAIFVFKPLEEGDGPVPESPLDAILGGLKEFATVMGFLFISSIAFTLRAVRLPVPAPEPPKAIVGLVEALVRVLTTPRLIVLTVIVAGFWIIQHQMYATMPKYVIRLLGEGARPEWLANVNPLVVVICVVSVNSLMSRRRAVTSMLVGMVMMPISAFCMSYGPTLEKITGPTVLSIHPLTLMMIIGIAIQGLAECFISPRFLEYFSLQAPKGQEGLYLGFSHLHSFISALAGFIMSGFLLDAYCPDPAKLPAGLGAAEKAAYYAQAHHIWYYFAAIGFVAAVAMYVFRHVTDRLDARAGDATAAK
ncbi:MAG: MFS transporter [Candidatus Riflebacteria bacterium]|nr:MFS transporter [Candidatus Riflebacteria bacterium]